MFNIVVFVFDIEEKRKIAYPSLHITVCAAVLVSLYRYLLFITLYDIP